MARMNGIARMKSIDPKNKSVNQKIQNLKKRLIKNVDDKYTKLFKPNEKILGKKLS